MMIVIEDLSNDFADPLERNLAERQNTEASDNRTSSALANDGNMLTFIRSNSMPYWWKVFLSRRAYIDQVVVDFAKESMGKSINWPPSVRAYPLFLIRWPQSKTWTLWDILWHNISRS